MNNDWEFDYQSQYQRGYTQPIPEMQPPVPDKKKGSAGKFFRSLGIVALCGVVGFGGGLAGSLAAGNKGSSIVYQAVDSGKNQGAPTSTGTNLSTAEIVNIAAPTVVEVTTEQIQTDSFFGQRILSGAGSGVIISADGYIITNNHVIEGATNIKITLSDQTKYDAVLVGADSRTDVALLKIEATGLKSAVVGNSDNLQVGEFSMAIGNPLGSLGGTVTTGVISALNRDIVVEGQTMNLLQTNAAVSPGNSGGGLFNEKGELIGIVNAKSADSDSEGIGFAIPINTAMNIVTEIQNNGYVTGRPALGIEVLTIGDYQTALQYQVSSMGVYITKVNQGSGAETAGLKAGDRIVAVGDSIVEESTDVSSAISAKSIGDTIILQVERDRQLLSYEVVLTEMKKG